MSCPLDFANRYPRVLISREASILSAFELMMKAKLDFEIE